MSQEFSTTEIQTVSALSKLDDFGLNSQVWVQYRIVPVTSWKFGKRNPEYNADCSQKDPHPEMGTSVKSSPHSLNLNPGQVHHKLTDVQEQIPSFSTGIQQASKEKSVPQSSHTFAVGTGKIEADQTQLAHKQWRVTAIVQFTVRT